MNEEVETQETHDAAAEAAFAESINGPTEPTQVAAEPVAAEPVAEVTPAEAPAQEAAPEAPSPVTLTAEEYAELRAMAPKVNEFQTELRKAHGRIGALNDLLQQTMKAKEAAGKPATLTAMELKRTREEFPELAEHIGADIGEWLSSQSGGQDPEAVKALVAQELARQQEERDREALIARQEALEEEHPDAREVINSEAFVGWVNALPEKERHVLQTTNSEFVVARKLTAFKAWHAEQQKQAEESAKAKEQSKKRLESAITPTGGGRQGQHVLSDREAAEKAFADAIKS